MNIIRTSVRDRTVFIINILIIEKYFNSIPNISSVAKEKTLDIVDIREVKELILSISITILNQ